MALLTPGDPADPLALQGALLQAMDAGGPAVVVGVDPARLDRDALPAGTALVLATSGSTGVPKRVALSAAALRASAAATAARIGEGAWVLALPASRIAGIQVLVRAALAGAPVQPAASGGAADVAAAAAALPAGAPAYTSLVPAQLRALLRDAPDALARFEAVLVGGQRTPPDLLEEAAERGIRVVRTYGSTETAGGCVYDGAPLPGVMLRIEAGEVLVAGEMLADGYVGEPAATAAAFPVRDGRRWYRTGDRGALAADGALQVTGRADNVIVSGGVNVSLDLVEAAVHTVPALRDAVVIGVADETWGEASVVVTAQGDARDLADARAAVERALGAAARPREVVRVGAVPLLASGKPDRVALRERFGGRRLG
ncbi:AMP-binding protein [Microbacterium limosum]|uniref:AMP-binding protein n=1 Tax=Microbacterium limosum TaxID=3079935 RepID=A0AAU0MHT4_9MICO|nr:AMP-binding protein [Microbacterium sp. Y20]WOQ70101.1 AMP-binding protein [Microbacterium sp. Y20]